MNLAEILPNGPELLHELPVFRRVLVIFFRAGRARDECPALFGRHDQPLAAQHLKPVPDRHRCDTVLPGQLALHRQPVADLVPA